MTEEIEKVPQSDNHPDDGEEMTEEDVARILRAPVVHDDDEAADSDV